MREDSAERPRPGQQTATRPTRGATRNQPLVEGTDQSSESALLPSLDPGVTLLDVEGNRGVVPLQSLVLDHLLTHEGPAVWVDADGHATTTTLARLAPSRRLLDRIHVARGFTAYQHYGALRALPDAVEERPSLVVAPALDARYRDEDSLADEHARTLQSRALARLATCAREDVAVIVTRTADDGFTAPIERAADHHLRCERTRMGPRFVGEAFETLVYPTERAYQTTFAYWRTVLGARAERAGLEPTEPTAASGGVGSGVLADGSTATLTPDPMGDAWANPEVR